MSNNEHGFESPSKLQNWIEHEMIHLAVHEQEEALPTELPDRNLSLRTPLATHLMLYRIAQKLGRSKTGCAEEIVTSAVKDVYRQFGLPPLSAADLEEYASQTEKVLPEKAGGGSRK